MRWMMKYFTHAAAFDIIESLNHMGLVYHYYTSWVCEPKLSPEISQYKLNILSNSFLFVMMQFYDTVKLFFLVSSLQTAEPVQLIITDMTHVVMKVQ